MFIFLFTSSSHFLPYKASRLREEIIRDYADYLHSIGRDDQAALKVYLKAYLLNPITSRFRLPLLTALKRTAHLGREEIDLLLVMFRSGTHPDYVLAAHLAEIFIKKNCFSRKTEPVFQAALESSSDNVNAVISFILPRLLKKNRLDEFAIKFYLGALTFHPYEQERLKETIARVWCEGHWGAIEPDLHKRCGEVFALLPSGERERIYKSVRQTDVSEKWNQIKLFKVEDFSGLRKLKTQFGLVKTAGEFLLEVIETISKLIKSTLKKLVITFLESLIIFSKVPKMIKVCIIFAMGILTIFGLIYISIPEAPSEFTKMEPLVSLSREEKKNFDERNREYTLQIAAMTMQKQADQMVGGLRKKGLKGIYIVKTRRPSGGYWYKVRLGKFKSKQIAQEFADKLKRDRVIENYFIFTPFFDHLN